MCMCTCIDIHVNVVHIIHTRTHILSFLNPGSDPSSAGNLQPTGLLYVRKLHEPIFTCVYIYMYTYTYTRMHMIAGAHVTTCAIVCCAIGHV